MQMPKMNVRKLLEVALPLEAINRAIVQEKSIWRGHPSTLHLLSTQRAFALLRRCSLPMKTH